MLCGQILADLGADVIHIEPPEGSPTRTVGPFLNDLRDPEGSLTWWSLSRNTRSIVLDLESLDGRETLKQLAVDSDFLIESNPPGWMSERGLGYGQLALLNPGLIYVSLTAFGQDGPKAHYRATDLTIQASSGALYLTGDTDRAPIRLSVVEQAGQHAGAEAAAAALVALYERADSDLGQHLDISAQQAVANVAPSQLMDPMVGDSRTSRASGTPSVDPTFVWAARDGYVGFTFSFGNVNGPFTQRFMDWAYEEGECDKEIRDKDWVGYGQMLMDGSEPPEENARVRRVVTDFLAKRTKEELFSEARKRRLLLVPVSTIEDAVESEQLAARAYWRDMEHAGNGTSIRYPGPFIRLNRTPIEYRMPPPTLGAHTDEVLGELGSNSATERHDAPAQPSGASTRNGGAPLAGLKVLDFMWVMAGPYATRVLADYGATVVKIEHPSRPDLARALPPFFNGQPGAETSVFYHSMAANKLGLTLDLSTPEGMQIVQDLVRWADVVAESFSAGVMDRLGLGYETLRRLNPELIMLSSCMMGHSGPMADLAGYGTMGSALTGFTNLAGWPDRAPVGPFGAYTDIPTPRYAAASLLAALDHRRRTGEGQFIDQSHVESALHFLGPVILDYTVNGRVAERGANFDAEMAPHGVYPTMGEDEWIAIAVRNDHDWRRLVALAGHETPWSDERFGTFEMRQSDREELDSMIAEWTRPQNGDELEGMLQSAGVPAYALVNRLNVESDAQLAHREHYVRVAHPLLGTTVIEGARSRLSRTPARLERPGPIFGQDNEHVLRDLLGYDDDRIAELTAAGALT